VSEDKSQTMRRDDMDIKTRLLLIVDNLAVQNDVGALYSDGELPHDEFILQIREFADHRGCGIAYESLVATIEAHPYRLSNKSAIALLELGLLFRFKTDRPEDKLFDVRRED
jgi:hypothetical protein